MQPPHRTLTDELAIERTALANERTLLAYIRTGLAIVAGGFAIAELVRGDLAPLAGAALVAVGVVLVLIGVWRFNVQRRRLRGATRD